MGTNDHSLGGEHFVNPGINYESRDLGARGIVVFLIVLAVSGVLIELLVWGMLRFYSKMTFENNVPTTGASQLYARPYGEPMVDPALRFPKPALQVDDVADLNKFRAQNEEILNSYGWVDKANGVVRIPIQQAIDEVAQKGLPVRPEENQPAMAKFGDGEGSIPGEGGGAGSLVNH
ncbi:MAG TPA: hypothetical protein VKW78_22300 [Terriglobales bacterium]|jgi:hypothetical protein|nr:hypothetical protein [Terriglobales bacterium]